MAGPHFGKALRSKASQKVGRAAQDLSNKQTKTHKNALESLKGIRAEYSHTGKVRNVDGVGTLLSKDDVYHRGIAPNLNTIIAKPHQDKILGKLVDKAKHSAENTPFGLGLSANTSRLKQKAQRYVVPHADSGLELTEDMANLTNRQKSDIRKKFKTYVYKSKPTEDVVNTVVKQYRQK